MRKNETEEIANMFLGPRSSNANSNTTPLTPEPTIQTKVSHVSMTPEEQKIVEVYDKQFPNDFPHPQKVTGGTSWKMALTVGLCLFEAGLIIGLITWFWR